MHIFEMFAYLKVLILSKFIEIFINFLVKAVLILKLKVVNLQVVNFGEQYANKLKVLELSNEKFLKVRVGVLI